MTSDPAAGVNEAPVRQPFAQVYAEHHRMLMRVASSMLPRHEAEDVVHDTLLGYWLHPHRHDPSRGSVATYLRMAVRGRTLDRVRSADAARRRETIWSADATSAFSDDAFDRREDVIDALRLLAPHQREAIVTSYWGDMTYAEAAASLGIPEGTYKSRVRTAMAQLREILGPAVATLEGQAPAPT